MNAQCSSAVVDFQHHPWDLLQDGLSDLVKLVLASLLGLDDPLEAVHWLDVFHCKGFMERETILCAKKPLTFTLTEWD